MDIAIEITRWVIIAIQAMVMVTDLLNCEKGGRAVLFLLFHGWMMFALYNM